MSSRRLVVALLVVTLAGSATAALAAPKKKPKKVERVAEGVYQTPAVAPYIGPASSGAISCEPQGSAPGCVSFPMQAGELYVDIALADQAGQAVYAKLFDSNFEELGEVCGASDQPIVVSGTAEVIVAIIEGPCADATPALATTGTITATFSNLP
ncbi:MAG TPA: hypothetical protein VNC78_10360 [Actinomycetota bacterium]|nr:hypothetical protein [Actinomycetota bacterium]